MVREQTLYIIRGIPGAGKTTLANKIVDALNKEAGYKICDEFENDLFFMKRQPDGSMKYCWNGHQMGMAIHWCEDNVRKTLEDGMDCVVANTFTKLSEFKSYIEMALELGVNYKVIHCDGGFQNVHDVPEASMQAMRERMKTNPFDGEIVYNVGDRLPL